MRLNQNQKPASVWRLSRLVLAVLTFSALAACAVIPQRTPLPEALASVAQVPGANLSQTPIRYWGDQDPPAGAGPTIETAILQSVSTFKNKSNLAFLSLSGGGRKGAFGAGYLVGWTARGDRPQFQVVTGISVGALIAPFAFLGASYDPSLVTAFDTLAANPPAASNPLGFLLGAPGLASNDPLKRAIALIITPDSLAAIAREHRKGRRLLIGTTNLDAERPVIWDIGAIANSAIPNKIALVRTILLASAALPGLYPPVLIHVVAGGTAYDELHVDGGVTEQVVLVPNQRYAPKAAKQPKSRVYVIYNGQINPAYSAVKPAGIDVLFKTVPTVLKYQGRADINHLRDVARTNGARFSLVSIPSNFKIEDGLATKSGYLDSLFKLGYLEGKKGDWQN